MNQFITTGASLLLASLSLAQDAKPVVVDPLANNPLFDAPPVDKLPPVAKPGAHSPEVSPATNVTANLLKLMVAKKLLSEEEAAGLIQQALAEAEQARAGQQEDAAFSGGPDDVRVTYIPDNVKQQMREDIKRDVMAQAKAEKWAAPGSVAEWTERIKFFGDIRIRSELDMFHNGNDNTGAFPDFNAINTGAPFDVAGTQFSPQRNVDQDRYRLRLRARLGADIELADNWFAGFRIGTGQDNSPITNNQSFGKAGNGQGGNFSKYQLWLDRAFVKYERGSPLADGIAFTAGRFDNPFFSTPLIWADEIGMDGLVLRGSKSIGDDSSVWLVGGLFPTFNTEFTYPSNQPTKFKSTDRYLYAAQLGVDFKVTEKIHAKFAAAYYDFAGIEGRVSTPYIPLTTQDAGDTDSTRPTFAQNGNTYRPLRTIIPSVVNNFGTSYQYQYFGLASPFKVATFTGKIDFNDWEPYQLSLIGEFAKNTAWNKESISAVAVNNRGVDPAQGQVGVYDGSDTAWLMRMQFGKEKFEKRGDWRAWIDYRSIGSDAVVDAFNDDDFGDGGTNVEGFTLGAQVALSKRTNVGVRWFSSNQITGPPLKYDIFMFDLQTKF